MDDPKTQPLAFADIVIQRLVNNLFGAEKSVEQKDYTLMRGVFRQHQGSWEQILKGNMKHILLLERIVTQWGQRA